MKIQLYLDIVQKIVWFGILLQWAGAPTPTFAADGWIVPSMIQATLKPNCTLLLVPAAVLFLEEIGSRQAQRQIILWNTLPKW